MVAAKVLDQGLEAEIGDARQVRGRHAGIHAAAAPSIDHGHLLPTALEQVGGRQPGDPGADHDDVDRQIPVERRITRHRRRVRPVGLRFELYRSGHPASPALRSNRAAIQWHG
jgi:hypothetical protein